MRILQKVCLVCNKIFQKPPNCGLPEWSKTRKYCSKICADKSPRSETTIRKISLRKIGRPSWNKGRPWPPNIREKMSLARRGVKLSEETRRKMSIAKTGQKQTLETRMKRSSAQQGNKGSNWQGGKTPITEQARKCLKYREWRKSVYERDSYTCQLCGKRGVRLNADHIKSFALYPELRYEVSNGRTVCTICHLKTDTYGGRSRATKRGSKNTNAT